MLHSLDKENLKSKDGGAVDMDRLKPGCNYEQMERKEKSNYLTVYKMRCDNEVAERFQNISDKLADKDLMFKFNGYQYAVCSLDIDKRTQITDYVLTLEQVEELAEQ